MATYEGQDDQDEQYVMLFQILGIAGLNQRAREVPPFKHSLTTTGLFVLLTRSRILFWAGSEYFASYLGENSFDQFQNLLSEELLTKLVFLYDQSQSLTVNEDEEDNHEESKSNPVNFEDRKISFCVEGIEGPVWHEYMSATKGAAEASVAARVYAEQQSNLALWRPCRPQFRAEHIPHLAHRGLQPNASRGCSSRRKRGQRGEQG